MSYDATTGTFTDSPLLAKLKFEKKAATELQYLKQYDWTENYELYRNRPKTNRLTQRQAVYIPLMKETIKTLLAKIDDPPHVEWKERSGDDYKQLVFQEIWDSQLREDQMELVDVLDKKNVLLYGVSTKMLNLVNRGVSGSVLDAWDVIFDPLMRANDVESARFIIRRNIFKSIREILADDKYDKDAKEELRIWADSGPGITQGTMNRIDFERRQQRLQMMRVGSKEFPYYAGGDRLINLTEHYYKLWNEKKKDWDRKVAVYAQDSIILQDELLDDLIGVDFWPFVVWSEDPETNDIYPDSVADLVRTPNKILNVWFSQMIENRTLKNFQMHWFSPSQNYQPTTYTPGPGVMLPAPPGEDIRKVLMPVEIPGLEETFKEIDFLTQIVERGTGATAIEKGEPESGTQTLGEVQILVGKANERVVGMAKFYRMAWYQYAWKWSEMMKANAPKMLRLYKKSMKGEMVEKRAYPSDWKSNAGYLPIVRSSSEQETENLKGVQKFMFILQQFPNNAELRRVAQKRMLEMVDLTPEEMKQIEDEEKQQAQAAQQQPQPQPGQPGQPQLPEPPNDNLVSAVHQKIGELNALSHAQ